MEQTIIETINKIKPFLMSHGGDIEFVKYEDHIVYIKVKGTCSHCDFLEFTLRDTVEAILTEEIPEVKEVRNVEDL